MIVSTLLFLLGVYLSMRMIAALYRIIDLWYAIGRELPRVLAGVMGWGAVIAVVALVAGDARSALLAGLLGYLPFYVGLYGLMRVLVRPRSRRSKLTIAD